MIVLYGRTLRCLSLCWLTAAVGLAQDRRGKLDQLLYQTIDTSGSAPVHSVSLQVSSGSRSWSYGASVGTRAPGDSRTVSAATGFPLASVTKLLTATLILQLKEAGKLRLDDSVSRFLPLSFVDSLHLGQGRALGRTITVRRLLRHTTGLPDYIQSDVRFLDEALKGSGHTWSRPALWERYFSYDLAHKTHFAPNDTLHSYSDTNYLLLGQIIEQVTGQSLAQVYRSRIFRPLNLRSAYLAYEEVPKASSIAWPCWGRVSLEGKNLSFDWGGGGLVMNGRDLHRFWRALLAGQLFRKKDTVNLLYDWVATHQPGALHSDYGLGIVRVQLPGQPVLLGHTGFYKSFVLYVPEQDWFITGSLNQAAANHRQFIEQVLDALSTH
jgi:D-alanyl-D-alanine carboxypeptidase